MTTRSREKLPRKRIPLADGSQLVKAPARAVPERTKILLAVRAGGRCEFDGCNKYLFEHPLTLQAGNFSQLAHIVAFSPKGPRGQRQLPRKLINTESNLMLLCYECHKHIDDRPEEFTVEILAEHKRSHEERICFVTELGPDRKTTIVKITSKIGGQTVAIPMSQVVEAVSPMYPADRTGCVIDLTEIEDEGLEFFKVAADRIRQKLRALCDARLDGSEARHFSLFALAPIPLLILVGRELGNKVPLGLNQRHRDTESWKWKTDGDPVRYEWRRVREGTDGARVALVLSLSGKVHVADLPAEIDARFSIYEITLAGKPPSPRFLRLREDLDGFKAEYLECISAIARDHVGLEAIHLFPAAPAPVAVLCGRELLPKVHPVLAVYDNDKRAGGFIKILEVNKP